MSKSKINIKIYLLILLGLIALIAVINRIINHDKPKGGNFSMKCPVNEESIDCNIKGASLYIDFSGSMRGFVDGKNPANQEAFKNFTAKMIPTVSNGLTNLEKKYDISTTSYCGSKAYGKADFLKAMENHSIFNQNVTLLHEMFRNNLSSVTDSTVNILVSDMVLSYGKQKLLKETPDYNKHQLGALAGLAYDVFSDLQKGGMHVVILQYYSDYNGKYYCNYTENITPCTYKDTVMKDRPFYVLLCGTEKNLRKIMADQCFDGFDNIYASFKIPELQTQSFTVAVDKKSIWKVGEDPKEAGIIWAEDAEKNAVAELTLTCNAFSVPKYVKVENLKLDFDQSIITNVTAPESYNGEGTYTYTVKLRPYGEWKSKHTPYITLTTAENWISTASTDDDTQDNVKGIEKKTWGFDALMKNINKAYFGSEDKPAEEVARFDFIVSKK